MRFYLTIDIGTTNWKALLFDEKGYAVCTQKCATAMFTAQDGLGYYDPAQIWSSVCALIKAILAQHGAHTISAVCVTSMGESVVPVDKNGECLSPIIPWFDTRSTAEAGDIIQTIGKERIFNITGTDAGPIFSLPKMLWMRNTQPQLFSRAVKWLQMADFINFKLCGNIATDYSMASRTLAFDIIQNQWSAEMLKPFGLTADLFPTIVPAGSIIGTLTNAASLQTGLPQGLPIVMGGHDHPVASLAGNVFGNGAVFNSSGTAEPYLYISDLDAPFPEKRLGQRLTRHPHPRRLITWGGIVASGVTVDWAAKLLAPDYAGSYDDLFGLSASLSPGSHGLLFHPHLRGSGAPWWDAKYRGAFLGLTSAHTQQHMLRAVLEGLCFQARIILDMHEALINEPISLIRCMGGGSRISLWQAIKSTVTNCVVETNPTIEATPLGAAMLAAVGVGQYASIEESAAALAPPLTAYCPDPSMQESYQKLTAIYRESYDALKQINYQLAQG